jgi:hypothetical protein
MLTHRKRDLTSVQMGVNASFATRGEQITSARTYQNTRKQRLLYFCSDALEPAVMHAVARRCARRPRIPLAALRTYASAAPVPAPAVSSGSVPPSSRAHTATSGHGLKPAPYGQPHHISHPHLVPTHELTPGFPLSEYDARRRKLVEQLPERSVVVCVGGSIKYMSHGLCIWSAWERGYANSSGLYFRNIVSALKC